MTTSSATAVPHYESHLGLWGKKQKELFEQRYADLLMVQLELAEFDLKQEEEDDPAIDAKQFEVRLRADDAERLLMTTHAVYAEHLWQKIAVFEHALHGEPDSEIDRIDNKKVWMFGCIKADLLSLGVGFRRMGL